MSHGVLPAVVSTRKLTRPAAARPRLWRSHSPRRDAWEFGQTGPAHRAMRPFHAARPDLRSSQRPPHKASASCRTSPHDRPPPHIEAAARRRRHDRREWHRRIRSVPVPRRAGRTAGPVDDRRRRLCHGSAHGRWLVGTSSQIQSSSSVYKPPKNRLIWRVKCWQLSGQQSCKFMSGSLGWTRFPDNVVRQMEIAV